MFIPVENYEVLLLKAALAPKATKKMTKEQLWHNLRGNENMKRRETIRSALNEATVVGVSQRQASSFPDNVREQVQQTIADRTVV